MNNIDDLFSVVKTKIEKNRRLNLLLILLFSAVVVSGILSSFIHKNSNLDHLGKGFIGEIKINGVIFSDEIRDKMLDNIYESQNIKALIVNVNSPGGEIVASEILYNKLAKISAKIPVVVVMNSVAASGAYMASIAGEYIIAHNGTITGSIGVLMQSPNVTELSDKIGIKMTTYRSGNLKAKPSLFDRQDPQADKLIMSMIGESAEFFTALVKERRKLNENQVQNIIDGRVFTSYQALAGGLIDKIGNRDDALNYLKTKHKFDTKNIKQIEIEEKKDASIIDFLGGKVKNFLGFVDANTKSNFGIMAIMAL